MFGRKRKEKNSKYNSPDWKPILKCSICNGEQVAGFKNVHTGEFKEQVLIRNQSELEDFKSKYQIQEITKEY